MTKLDLYGPARDVIAAFDSAYQRHHGDGAQVIAAIGAPLATLRAALAPPLTPAQLRAAGQIEEADKAAESLIYEASGRIVGDDVKLCVSWLVSELFKRAGEPESIMTDDEAEALAGRGPDADDMRDQLPAGQYTVEEGIDPSDGAKAWRWFETAEPWNYDEEESGPYAGPPLDGSYWFETEQEALADLYESERLDPAEGCEALEHWAVSRWLAEKLSAKGESVIETDWAGHVWARCTSGQMIRMDSVIQQIARDLYARELTGSDSDA